jgi:hypothetical protein
MVSYHSLLCQSRIHFQILRKWTTHLTTDQGGFDGIYELREVARWSSCGRKVLTKLETEEEEFINGVASISRTSHINTVSLLGFCHERTERAI